MIQAIDLRSLAQRQGNGRDFVSVYFAREQGLDVLKGRERNIRSLLEDNPLELENFDASMKMIRELLEKQSIDAESVCMFASAVMDFVEGYPLQLPVAEQLYVGPSPYIRPLAELQDEYETFAVVATNNDGTRIYLVTDEAAEVEDRIKGGVKNHVRKGGWSQQRYERRRDNQLQHYARDVAEALENLQRQYKVDRIVLIGSAETMQEIENELPEPLAAKVVGKEPLNLRDGEEAVVDQAYELYFAQERNVEQQLWERIRNEYMKHGMAAVGATHVLQAALQGRVATMIVTRDAKIAGTRCRDCETLVHGTPQTCQSCGSKSVFEVDLVDELSRLMELTSASVDFVDPIEGLTKVGHVGALLRY